MFPENGGGMYDCSCLYSREFGDGVVGSLSAVRERKRFLTEYRNRREDGCGGGASAGALGVGG